MKLLIRRDDNFSTICIRFPDLIYILCFNIQLLYKKACIKLKTEHFDLKVLYEPVKIVPGFQDVLEKANFTDSIFSKYLLNAQAPLLRAGARGEHIIPTHNYRVVQDMLRFLNFTKLFLVINTCISKS